MNHSAVHLYSDVDGYLGLDWVVCAPLVRHAVSGRALLFAQNDPSCREERTLDREVRAQTLLDPANLDLEPSPFLHRTVHCASHLNSPSG